MCKLNIWEMVYQFTQWEPCNKNHHGIAVIDIHYNISVSPAVKLYLETAFHNHEGWKDFY